MKPLSSLQKLPKLPSIALIGAVAIACAGPAAADKRHPAPIVYATGTSPYPAGTPQYIEPSQASDAQAKKQARIEFRYPGETGTNYAATSLKADRQGSEIAPAPAPQTYASVDATYPAWPEPTINPDTDSFKARAAAARAEAQRTFAVVSSEALPSLVPAPVPAPVTPDAPADSRDLTPAAVFAVAGQPVPVFDEAGIGIVYGDEFNGLPTANGEVFDPNALTAAHPSLPLPSLIQVINTQTGKEVVLRVNDRGPFEDGAALQVSPRAAAELGMTGAGKARLRIRYLGSAPAVNTPVQSAQPAQLAAQDTYIEAPAGPDYLVSASLTAAKTRPSEPTKYTYSVPQPNSAEQYFVQIGSFADISNAQALSNQVEASLPVTIVPARVNGADFFRVRVGPLPSRDAAERARQNLSYAGIAEGRVVSGD